MTLTNENYRKLAELAWKRIHAGDDGAEDCAVGDLCDFGKLRPPRWIWTARTASTPVWLYWRPEADMNQLAELLEAVGRKRGWVRTETIRYSYAPAPVAFSFTAFAKNGGTYCTYIDCHGTAATETEAKLDALLGIE
jgi:hypothetical protein